MLIAETERISASSYAVRAFLEPAIRLAKLSENPDSDSAGTNRVHGAAHHRPLVVLLSKSDFDFVRGLRIVSWVTVLQNPDCYQSL